MQGDTMTGRPRRCRLRRFATLTSSTPEAPRPQPSEAQEQSAATDWTASSVGKAMKAELGSVTKTINLTEDTDGNNPLGRPHQ